ncbi:MbtH family NRPS accessory protein [Gulosibacter hominis]|uniref:MbtH family NRPS accessory protein n=1 Tax=Gulosibacter TaxID=256818 RepID=UPI0019195D4D
MASVFDDERTLFIALRNSAGEYSIWPCSHPVPAGWDIVYGEPNGMSKTDVVSWVDDHWVDLQMGSTRVDQREVAE